VAAPFRVRARLDQAGRRAATAGGRDLLPGVRARATQPARAAPVCSCCHSSRRRRRRGEVETLSLSLSQTLKSQLVETRSFVDFLHLPVALCGGLLLYQLAGLLSALDCAVIIRLEYVAC